MEPQTPEVLGYETPEVRAGEVTRRAEEVAYRRDGQWVVYGLVGVAVLVVVVGSVHSSWVGRIHGWGKGERVQGYWAMALLLIGVVTVGVESFRAAGVVRGGPVYLLVFLAMWLVSTVLLAIGVVLMTFLGMAVGGGPVRAEDVCCPVLAGVAAGVGWYLLRCCCWGGLRSYAAGEGVPFRGRGY